MSSLQFADKIEDTFGKLAGGDLSIGDFTHLVMSAEWEVHMAANSASLHLLWDIRNLLYQYWDEPDPEPSEIIQEILGEYEAFTYGHEAELIARTASTRAEVNLDSNTQKWVRRANAGETTSRAEHFFDAIFMRGRRTVRLVPTAHP